MLWRFWQSDRQETDRPLAMPSAAALSASPTLTSSSTIPTPTIASKGAGSDAGETLAVQRETFIQHLHVLETTNPRLAASLALEDRQRYPNTPDAEERDVVLVAALHNQRDIDGASSEAWYYFVHHPNGQFTSYLSELTGVCAPTTRPLR